MVGNYKVITLCGSTRFKNEFLEELVDLMDTEEKIHETQQKAMNLIDSRQGISMADVADQCGFDAYPNFVRSFKNVCGITPTDYRRGIDTKK